MLPGASIPAELLFSLLAAGALGGFLSGLLGLGGGVIFVPALYYTLHTFLPESPETMHIAVGTSMALVLVNSFSSSFWHHRKGAVDFSIIKKWVLPLVCGVAVGSTFASAVNGSFLKQLFSVVLLAIAFYMALSREPAKESPAHRVSLWAQRGVMGFVGMLASMIGVGGAMLNIPFMTYLGIPLRTAVGTGTGLAIVTAIPTIVSYVFHGMGNPGLPPYSLGYVNLAALAIVLPASMLLSPVGVHVSHKLSRGKLKRIFSIVLALVALHMFLD